MEKVLIIDDDARNIFAMRAVLSARGFQCTAADNGRQALTFLQEQPGIGVALVDIMMPGMDGFQLIQEIRKDPSLDHVHLVAVTAQAMPGDREKCLAVGADDYLSKPVDTALLFNILHDASKKRR
ncbi:MAG: response regulator [Bacteroidota bacterium]